MANALKDWLEESGEMIKDRIEVEIEKAGERLGFIRKEELEKIESNFESRIDALEQQIKLLSNVADAKVKATKAAKDKASPAKKKASPVKKVSVKKVATKKAASSSVKEKKSPAKKAAK